jgi:chemotaxis protein MotB
MLRKRHEENQRSIPTWLNTFADLMSLLLCFFVFLFSMSTLDTQKAEQVAASFAKTAGIRSSGTSETAADASFQNGVKQISGLDAYTDGLTVKKETEYRNDTETSLEQKVNKEGTRQSEELEGKIQEALDEMKLHNTVSVDATAQYVQLTMEGSLLFDSGSTELKKESKDVLNKAGIILQKYAEGTIEIEGHTDNVPISNSNFSDNDELSSARALTVFRYLVSSTNLNPAHIRHSGRGDYVPVADNSTPQGRAENRRVEIRIYNIK